MIKINLLKCSQNQKKVRVDSKRQKKLKFQENMILIILMVQEIMEYGGYYYDGRWVSVAKDIIKFLN